MSQPRFPQGTFCRLHPNFKGLRPPQNRVPCSICEFLYQMFGKKATKPVSSNGITEADYVPPVEDRDANGPEI